MCIRERVDIHQVFEVGLIGRSERVDRLIREGPVSYTHLDVYKRQLLDGVAGLLDVHLFALDPHLTGGMGTQAEDAFHQLGALCAQMCIRDILPSAPSWVCAMVWWSAT